jgi:hypothetical protein
MLTTIDTNALSNVTGGAGWNTGITGGLTGINNQVPRPPQGGWNTGITGGLTGINNKVPPPALPTIGNTGITGGLHGINNKVPF